ncbi:MAG: DUF4116 domain-containing protein [Desulfovibrio sp.]|nr:DUF4116 domain-containing protein [Desulfovibrio sp.]
MPKKLRTKDLCREALEQTGWVLQYVPDCFKTKEICMAVVKDCGEALGGVPKRWRTKDLAWPPFGTADTSMTCRTPC